MSHFLKEKFQIVFGIVECVSHVMSLVYVAGNQVSPAHSEKPLVPQHGRCNKRRDKICYRLLRQQESMKHGVQRVKQPKGVQARSHGGRTASNPKGTETGPKGPKRDRNGTEQ